MAIHIHKKLLSTLVLLLLTECSSHHCFTDETLCSTPVDSKVTSNGLLSYRADVQVGVSVNDTGLRESWYATLQQDPDNKPDSKPDPRPCVAATSSNYRCIDLQVNCEPSGACTVQVRRSDLMAKKMTPGHAWLVLNQPTRSLGTTAQVDIQDPNFDFAAWVEIPLAQVVDSSNAKVNIDHLLNVGIINNNIYLARYYISSTKILTSDIIYDTRLMIGSSVVPLIQSSDRNDPAFTSRYTFSDLDIWSIVKYNSTTETSYNFANYNSAGGLLLNGKNQVALESTKMTAFSNFSVSPDAKALFVSGVDGRIYTSSLPLNQQTLTEVTQVPGNTTGLLIAPLSASSFLYVLPQSAHRFDSVGGTWTDHDLSSTLTTMKATAIGTGDLTKDTWRELVVANDQQVTFYQNDGANSFTSVAGALSLPAPGVAIAAIAVGDLDGQPGLDLAVITKDKLYIALHR